MEADLRHTRCTNVGPYLVSFKVEADGVTHWGNRVIQFGLGPEVANIARGEEQITLMATASHLMLAGLTDLTVVSGYEGSLRVRYRSLACDDPDEVHEFRVTGPRSLLTAADIKGLEYELTLYTAYNGITIIDLALVTP